MGITLRLEEKADYFETEAMTREAFWDVYKPGCDEHFVLHVLRESKAFIPELGYLACEGGRIVGSIAYSRARVGPGDGRASEVLCMGPIGVLPGFQGRGVGSMLLEMTIVRARDMGFPGVVIFGNPAFYGRFGFQDARRFGISTADGENFDAFMALELAPGRLAGIAGRFHEDDAFIVDKEKFEAYDAAFPRREKHRRPGQLFGE